MKIEEEIKTWHLTIIHVDWKSRIDFEEGVRVEFTEGHVVSLLKLTVHVWNVTVNVWIAKNERKKSFQSKLCDRLSRTKNYAKDYNLKPKVSSISQMWI